MTEKQFWSIMSIIIIWAVIMVVETYFIMQHAVIMPFIIFSIGVTISFKIIKSFF